MNILTPNPSLWNWRELCMFASCLYNRHHSCHAPHPPHTEPHSSHIYLLPYNTAPALVVYTCTAKYSPSPVHNSVSGKGRGPQQRHQSLVDIPLPTTICYDTMRCYKILSMPYAIHIVKFNGSPKRLQSTKPPDLYHLQYWHRDIWAEREREPSHRYFFVKNIFYFHFFRSLTSFFFLSSLLLFSTSFCSVSPARPRAYVNTGDNTPAIIR